MNTNQKISLGLGILLPLVLVIVVWTMMQVQQMKIPDPQYNFIYAIDNYTPAKFLVRNHQIYLHTFANKNSQQNTTTRYPKIYIYDIEHHTSTEINYQNPVVNGTGEQYHQVFKLNHYIIIPGQNSPDGYEYRTQHSGTLLSIFSSGRTYRRFLTKQGKHFDLNLDNQKYYIDFLGWMVPEATGENRSRVQR